MRVLQVIPAVAPRYGGPSSVILHMCRALQNAGVEVSLATTDADGPGRLSVPCGVEIDHEGVPTRFFPRQLSESFKVSYGLSRWLRRSVAAFDIVHVHALFSHSSLAAAAACRRAGVPHIVSPHGMLDPWALGRKGGRKRLLLAGAVRPMIAAADRVHFTTEQERVLAERAIGPTRGVVIPFGVADDLLASPLASAERQPYVLVLARLHPVKNLEALIDAFLSLVQDEERFSAWRLIVAGDGDAAYRAHLQARAARPGLADRVTFPGWVQAEAKANLLRRAALFAQPSHQENFGVSLVEALACGVPAIVSASVNLSEEVARAGAGWVTEGTVSALTSTLREAMGSSDHRERRSAAATTLATRFRWSSIAQALRDLYTDVAAHVSLAPAAAENCSAPNATR